MFVLKKHLRVVARELVKAGEESLAAKQPNASPYQTEVLNAATRLLHRVIEDYGKPTATKPPVKLRFRRRRNSMAAVAESKP